MSDIFDIGGSAYRSQHKTSEDYNHRRGGGWNSVDTNKDPRLSRREDGRNRYSPGESPHQRGHRRSTSPSRDSGWRSPKQTSQMYSQQSHQQYQPQPPPPPPIYSEQYNSGYGAVPTTYPGYQQAYQQQNTNNFNQYNQQRSYQPQPPPPPPAQGYNNSQHQQQQQQQQQPGPPGDDYPSTAWAPVQQPIATSYTQQQPPPVPRPPSVSSTAHSETKTDDLKKEAIANELKQQRATLIKQRDDYLRKASVLRRELEKLRSQKHELLSEKSPPRDSQRILRENAKLQLEIQNKLKSINNVVDMLSGIIGDGLKAADYEEKTVSTDNSPKQQRTRKSSSRQPGTDSSNEEEQQAARSGRETNEKKEDQSRYNYIHYDPELHWCRVCDVFPRSAKDLLTHLHSTEHRQVTQEHQLVDTPWHKLPADPELPTFKGAPVKRVPIKGLQFFISATAWYCKLCDVWIGDLHCASLHLKSKNHAHNYSNFVEQNPHWESNWLKDREKAYARCSKAKQEITESTMLSLAPESNEKSKSKSRKNKLDFLDSSKEKKRKKKSKKRKKVESSGSSSSSSSSSNSSTEDESDKAKSIRVAMRNKMRMQAQMILNEEIGNKVEVLEKLIEERNRKKEEKPTPPPPPPEIAAEDNIINQWMTVNPSQDKQIFDNLKGRLKQRQKADEEKAVEAAVEQRRREREREERELKELREREEKEMQERMKAEQEREEHEREERERFKERFRRKRRSDSRSPDYYSRRSRSRGRSRSRSSSRKHYRGRSNDRYRPESPDDKYKPKPREYEDEESQFDKRNSDSYKFKHSKSQSSSNSKKLPFIGRMPLFKKKPESGGHSHEHKSSSSKKKKEDYEVRLSKFESGITARPFIPEPGVVHIIKLATPQESTQTRISAENPPPPPKIIPEPPQISETAPPPPMINNVVTTIEETEVQDMELDDAVALPPGVPVAEAKPIARPAGNHLPRDFQEALNIIFPGDQRPDQLAAAVQNDPNLMMQYQYGMQYGMMYSNMQMYDYNNMAQDELVPEEEEELEKVEDIVPPPPPDLDDKEDLAMLGIDAEDMAAQTF